MSLNINAGSYLVKIQDAHTGNVSIEGDKKVTCIAPQILNYDNTCVDEITKVEDDVGWIYRNSDNCKGMRAATFDPNVFFVRARTYTYVSDYPIPSGYKWLTKEEYVEKFENSNVVEKNNKNYIYYVNQCGLKDYPIYQGYNQLIFAFKGNNGSGVHAGTYEYRSLLNLSEKSVNNNFAGYVLYKM